MESGFGRFGVVLGGGGEFGRLEVAMLVRGVGDWCGGKSEVGVAERGSKADGRVAGRAWCESTRWWRCDGSCDSWVVW